MNGNFEDQGPPSAMRPKRPLASPRSGRSGSGKAHQPAGNQHLAKRGDVPVGQKINCGVQTTALVRSIRWAGQTELSAEFRHPRVRAEVLQVADDWAEKLSQCTVVHDRNDAGRPGGAVCGDCVY